LKGKWMWGEDISLIPVVTRYRLEYLVSYTFASYY
jgi:hypothetical protein